MSALSGATFALVILLACATSSPALASGHGRLASIAEHSQRQSGAVEVKHGKGPPPTIEDELKRHGIQFTRPALIAALRNTDPEVRGLAAQKLAQEKATEAIPAMLEALASERAAPTRVSIAFSVAQLGEERGFGVLQETCGDPSIQPWLRLRAADYMLDFLRREDQTCRTSVLGILQSQPSYDSFVVAVSILRRFQGSSQQEGRAIFQSAVKALAATDPSLRLVASRVLGELGDLSAIPYLQKAVAKERDKIIRSQMRTDLGKLQQKQGQ